MPANTLFAHEAPHVARQPKTDRLILQSLLKEAATKSTTRMSATH